MFGSAARRDRVIKGKSEQDKVVGPESLSRNEK